MAGSNFFVYIIESPSDPDIYHGRGEGETLRRALHLAEIPAAMRTVISRQALVAALTVGLIDAVRSFNGPYPVIHISGHGNEEGIAVSSGEVIPWKDLAELLRPINQSLNGELVVLMSSCQGLAGATMAMEDATIPLPFLVLVGSKDRPTWAETLTGSMAFYHRSRQGANFADAVEAMRAASGHQGFQVSLGEQTRNFYLAYVQSFNAEKLRLALAAEIAKISPNDSAKAAQLEGGKILEELRAGDPQN